jgi:hypothetical protein
MFVCPPCCYYRLQEIKKKLEWPSIWHNVHTKFHENQPVQMLYGGTHTVLIHKVTYIYTRKIGYRYDPKDNIIRAY